MYEEKSKQILYVKSCVWKCFIYTIYLYVLFTKINLLIFFSVETNNNESMATHKKSSYRQAQRDLRNRTLAVTDTVLGSKAMQDFLKNDNTKYNLIILELFHTEAFYIFSHIYDAPIVGLSSFGHAHFINQIMGNPLELSYVAHENLQLPKRFKIFDRLKNTMGTIVNSIEGNWWIDSEQEGLVKKYFSHLKEPLPNLKELEKKVELVLVNSHFTVDTLRPLVPGIVEVGGLHVKKAENLPKVGLTGFKIQYII